MANTIYAVESGILDRVLGAIRTVFQTIGTALTVNASAEARLQQVQKLHACSDEKLAELGIERDRIVQYVFRDIYMI